MADIQILGDIAPSDYEEVYEWFGYECTTPRMVQRALEEAGADEAVDVYINSPGGYVSAGQEIYSRLRGDARVRCHVIGQACSAASLIAMAGYCDIAPVGLLMVHCSATIAEGNHREMESAARALKTIDRAIAEAYSEKSGMPLEDAVKMMEKETWLTANQCVELGLCDAIMPSSEGIGGLAAVAAAGSPLVTEAMLAEFRASKAKEQAEIDAIVGDLDDFGSHVDDLIGDLEGFGSRVGG